jgi:hypothetical protein
MFGDVALDGPRGAVLGERRLGKELRRFRRAWQALEPVGHHATF